MIPKKTYYIVYDSDEWARILYLTSVKKIKYINPYIYLYKINV